MSEMNNSVNTSETADVVILGGGPGGYVCAIRCAQYGLSTILVEREHLGGTCLNWGCIPTKALVASARAYQETAHLADLGVDLSGVSFDYSRMAARKNTIVAGLRDGVGKLLKGRKVRVVKGTGTMTGPGEITVTGTEGQEVLKGRNIVLATGSETLAPGPMAIDPPWVLGSTEALDFQELPESIAIIGGGVIGCEFASMLSALGVKVHVIEALSRLLPREDRQLGTFLRTTFKKRGIEVFLGSRVVSLEKNVELSQGGRGVSITLENGSVIQASTSLVAIGRKAVTSELGLEKAGVAAQATGYIPVNENMQTNIANIYAIGDVTGRHFLAHTASHGGVLAAAHIAGKPVNPGFDTVPGCIFTIPEVASVGSSEDSLKEAGTAYKVGRFPFLASGKAQAAGHSDGFVKLLVDPETDRILGGCIAGEGATDMIAEIALAMRNGITAHQVADTIHAHPTLAEGVAEAAESALGLPIHTMGAWLIMFLVSLALLTAPIAPLFSQSLQQVQSDPDITFDPAKASKIALDARKNMAVRDGARISAAIAACKGIVMAKFLKLQKGTGIPVFRASQWLVGEGGGEFYLPGQVPAELLSDSRKEGEVILFLRRFDGKSGSLYEPLKYLERDRFDDLRSRLNDPRGAFLRKSWNIEDLGIVERVRPQTGQGSLENFKVTAMRSSVTAEDLLHRTAFVSMDIQMRQVPAFTATLTGLLRSDLLEPDFDPQALLRRMETLASILKPGPDGSLDGIGNDPSSAPLLEKSAFRLVSCKFSPSGSYDRLTMNFRVTTSNAGYDFSLEGILTSGIREIGYQNFSPQQVLSFISEVERRLFAGQGAPDAGQELPVIRVAASRGAGKPALFTRFRGCLVRWVQGEQNPRVLITTDLLQAPSNPAIGESFDTSALKKWLKGRNLDHRAPLIFQASADGWSICVAGAEQDLLETNLKGKLIASGK